MRSKTNINNININNNNNNSNSNSSKRPVSYYHEPSVKYEF